MAIIRNVVRLGLIGGIALGGAAAILGPQRVMSGLHQVRTQAQEAVEARLDETLAVRRELARLANEYPDKIAGIQTDLAEIDRQLEAFEHDREVAGRVVALATEDLSQLRDLVAEAEAAAETTTRRVALRFEGARMSIDEAYRRGDQIRRTLVSYQDRVAHADVQVEFLGEQKARLEELLADLQDEYETYRAQLWQLDREIEAIERNERLIEMTEEQVATLDAMERSGRVTNLSQVEAKLDEIKRRQEAQLEQLRSIRQRDDYEAKARMELMTEPTSSPFDLDVLEPREDVEEPVTPARRSVALADPLVID